ncbi:hypothetical protein N7478_001118 [Penicillium angulare]|uniref:uncharacterized protein n=1 Tax=Penicillium angulare TaxID=116970 RepID=UPI00254069B5|nr:uncharacterized protein N7478_001118 [Penicillium angulare]KAJ5291867.1 hypothetical protein N7478_001118 [Penicillium angulare]
MSAPTRQLNRLSIGQNMSGTGAQSTNTTRSEREDPSDDNESDRENDSSSLTGSESDSGDDDGGSSDEEQEPSGRSTVRARSGITYDLSSLDGESGPNALVGLKSQFDVVNCRGSDHGYDFQLLDRAHVHVGSDSTTCTCSTFKAMPQVACQHIFWVLDQLHSHFHPNPSAARAVLSRDGRPQVRPRIEELLKEDGTLEEAAEKLNWQCLRDDGDGDGKLYGMTRTEKVRDVLSAFTPKVLPEVFRQDLVETVLRKRTATAGECVVQGDFEATMFRLAIYDDSVFSSLCKVMPSGACSAIYFDKIQVQSRRLLSDFDRYCATGERPTDPSSPGGGIIEVDEVVDHLRRAVSRIQANILSRAPHGSEGAANALVWMLESIASRNKDPLDGNNLGRSSFHGEDEDQRNLYHLLIGSEDMDLKPDEDLFVLSALESLPASSLYPRVQELRNILRKIEVNRAPRAYLLKLGTLIRAVESAGAAGAGSSAATGLGQKRPAAGSSGGYSKRSR